MWIRQGRIVAVMSPDVRPPEHSEYVDATRLIVAPGFVDLHVHFREPGFEYKETIATGSAAAVAGGFTTVCCMPNTKPVNDSAHVTTWIMNRARATGAANVYPIGAITKGLKGRELNDFLAMKEAGCVAVSDDGRPVMDGDLMRRAMRLAADVDLPVIDHCEDLTLSRCGCVNEGPVSRALGLRAMPAAAEERIVQRDIALARETGAKLHIAHVSTKGTVEAVRRAKAEGVRVTAEACPHHFSLTEEAVFEQGTDAKMNPPLRGEPDRLALIEGLRDDTIDAIATDHAPHAAYEKQRGMDRAPFGVVGLETALGLSLRLAEEGALSLSRVIGKMSSLPARLLGVDHGTFVVGARADIVLIDRAQEWIVDPEQFYSKGRNTPFSGWRLKGRVIRTLVSGRTVFDRTASR